MTQGSAPPPDWAIAVTVFLLVAIVTVPLMLLQSAGDRRARQLLDEWARANGLELTEPAEKIGWGRGPVAMRARFTTVFRISTRAPNSAPRSAWICMNNTFIWGCEPEVVWDA
jgi:hypothetical protein